MSCLACKQEGKRPRYVKPLPAVQFYAPVAMPGHPTLEHHRLGARFIAERVFYLGFDEPIETYELSKAEVLVCCWWAGLWGPRKLQKAWREWATSANSHLWYSCVNVPPPYASIGPAQEEGRA